MIVLMSGNRADRLLPGVPRLIKSITRKQNWSVRIEARYLFRSNPSPHRRRLLGLGLSPRDLDYRRESEG